jgi:hypothetical protein
MQLEPGTLQTGCAIVKADVEAGGRALQVDLDAAGSGAHLDDLAGPDGFVRHHHDRHDRPIERAH